MNRRKFLLVAGAGLTAILAGCRDWLDPDLAPLPTSSPPGTPTATPEPTATLTVTPTPTEPPLVPVAFFDDFSDPRPAGAVDGTLATDGRSARRVPSDSAGQVAIADGLLRITGEPPVAADPLVYASFALPCAAGQVAGARFKVGGHRALSRLGVLLPSGAPIAALRREAYEGAGGVLQVASRTAASLNLYSGCWYDLALFFRGNQVALALNDGAGLELVQLGALDDRETKGLMGYIGYAGLPGDSQDASVDFWYALAQPYFPPTIATEAAPGGSYETDLGTNAAWVEVNITRAGGAAGLRVRSADAVGEYRVYLDERGVFLDQVIEGVVKPLATHAVEYRPGAALAVRFDELTLTIYYDGQLVGKPNLKIGATQMIAATRAGIYATGAGSTFSEFNAFPVRLDPPASVRERLLASRQVLCLGDSLTNGDLASGYQNSLRKSLGDGWVTVDCGVGGQVTYQMLSRLPTHLAHYRPAVVVVMGGTNDVYSRFSASLVKSNLQKIYTAARQAGARVVAVTIPPLATAKGWTEEQQTSLQTINAWIMGDSVETARDVDFRIDSYVVLADPRTRGLASQYDVGDHIHLNGPGYQVLAEAIYLGVKW
ncbi:MAG TPA: GDSL-type esterase/lipase family protein [Anaerolineaceae bacterium]|nr:GDSL-type esterase/lipase family protein [Anaerolineaceae bacterium]